MSMRIADPVVPRYVVRGLCKRGEVVMGSMSKEEEVLILVVEGVLRRRWK
jgi:hypothetical protein